MKRNQNVTITVPTDILSKARRLAARRNTSLSSLVSRALADLLVRADGYDQARQRNLALLSQGLDLGTQGGANCKREALHDRSSEK